MPFDKSAEAAVLKPKKSRKPRKKAPPKAKGPSKGAKAGAY